jgi:hypothetical protein
MIAMMKPSKPKLDGFARFWMDLLCTHTDLALELNPQILDKKYAHQAKRRIRILSKT